MLLKKLETSSREGKPFFGVKVGSKLFESALGSIYFSKLLHNKNYDEEKSVILKTLNLSEQNIWAITLENKKTTLRNFPAKKVLFMHQEKDEAKDWLNTWCRKIKGRESALLCKIAWIQEDCARDGATKVMRLNEYLNEAFVGLVLSRHLKVPHFVCTHDAWISNATGFILQDYGGENLLKKMIDFNEKDFKSIIVQVLITLAIAQDTLHLKHHDLHLENVFVNRLKDTDVVGDSEVKLNSAQFWAYDIQCRGEQKTIFIEHQGIIARIADFGLSSITDPDTNTRFERVDYELLDSTEAEWGQWSGTLENQKMYDAVVFLSKFFGDPEQSLCSTKNVQWARSIFLEMKAKWPEIECSNIGRPLRFKEGRERIVEIFTLPVFEEFLVPQTSFLKLF